MFKILKKSVIALLLICIIFTAAAVCYADKENYISENNYKGEIHKIFTAEDFLAIRDNPYGKFELQNDIDLSGFDYVPFVFSGYLNGNGHMIFNVSISRYSEETRVVYDCNHKPYDAHFSGLFGLLEGAWIENLYLLPVEINLNCDAECIFTGGLCGYMVNSYAYNVSVIRNTTKLATSGKCWGAGGLAGYGGESKFYNCIVNAVLTCTDNDINYKDEQFMGGAYALGYIDLEKVTVCIDGYDADHGYVHDGGLVGSYYKYNGNEGWGMISDCEVTGKITFFEDNKNRRAYCAPYIGEVMHWSLDMNHNSQSFTRDEIFDYSAQLGPHWDCSNPVMEDKKTESDYQNYGCTTHTCKTCGYTYSDNYTLTKVKAKKATIIADKLSGAETGDYVGESYHIEVSFEPADASPLSFELVSDDNSVGRITHSELEYNTEKGTLCDALISFEIPGNTKLRVLVDGEELDSIDFKVKSHKDYIWDTYKRFIISAACAIIAIICGIIISAIKKKEHK